MVEMIDIHAKATEICDDTLGSVNESFDELIQFIRDPDEKITRSILAEKVEDLKKRFVEEMTELAKTFEEVGDEVNVKRMAAEEEIEEIKTKYDTAMHILDRDAGVSERDLFLVEHHSDPVKILARMRTCR